MIQQILMRYNESENWKSLGRVWLFVTPWAGARQAPLSIGFSRQEYWTRLPFPVPAKGKVQ